MNTSEARQQRVTEVISTYQRFPGDTGSTEVQGMPGVLFNFCMSDFQPLCLAPDAYISLP
jgi:hypothetical protein